MSASTQPSSPAQAEAPSIEVAYGQVRHRRLLLLAVMMISICQFFDATIANVALPHMQNALGASSDSISWVLTSFIIATAIATPVTGWLSDRIGSRTLFIGAAIVFLLTSAACGAATSLVEMVAFRTLQGISAAFIGPLTQTIMFDVSPPGKQAQTMAIFGMLTMIAPISGPFVGGFLTENLNWRWIFYVNLPIGIPALILLWWLLPSRPILKRKLDMFGFSCVALALGALQLLLDRGQHKDWFSSWEIIIELLVVVSALWVFFIHTRTSEASLFRRELFANPHFLAGLASMGILGISVVGLSAVLPMLFQSIYHYPVMDAGMLMAPRGLGVMVTSLMGAWLMKRIDFRVQICAGYLIAAFSLWMMAGWALVMDTSDLALAGFLQGLGLGLVLPPMNMMAFGALKPECRPDGASLFSLARSLGGSIGISVVITLLARNQQTAHADVGSHITANSLPGADLPALVDRVPGFGTAVMAMIDGEVNRQALMIAFIDNFAMLAVLLLCFAPLPFLLRKPRHMVQQQQIAHD